MSRSPSLLARALAPFSGSLWTLFSVWTAMVAAVWISGFGDAELQERITNPGLHDALAFFLKILDPAWFALAAANGYLALVEEESLAVARRWAGLILGIAWLISAASAWTRFPLGAIHFTTRLGMRIGPVPFGLLLLWVTFVLGARSLVLRIFPRASHLRVSFAAGVAVALSSANLDPLAWKYRAFWLWRALTPGTLWQNATVWLLASFALVSVMRETRVASSSGGGFPRSAVVLLLVNAIFLLTHAARFLRN